MGKGQDVPDLRAAGSVARDERRNRGRPGTEVVAGVKREESSGFLHERHDFANQEARVVYQPVRGASARRCDYNRHAAGCGSWHASRGLSQGRRHDEAWYRRARYARTESGELGCNTEVNKRRTPTRPGSAPASAGGTSTLRFASNPFKFHNIHNGDAACTSSRQV